MTPNKTTLAIKARLANKLRKYFYKAQLEKFTQEAKIDLFNQLFQDVSIMHWELNDYKAKRKEKAELKKKRLASPQTKSMRKKFGLIPKTPLKDPRLEK